MSSSPKGFSSFFGGTSSASSSASSSSGYGKPASMKQVSSMSTSASFNSEQGLPASPGMRGSPAANSGLSGRNFKGSDGTLNGSSHGAEGNNGAAGSPHTLDKPTKKVDVVIEQRVRYVPDVSRYYSVGEEVMPSTHRGSKVCYGRRESDGMEVVVKVRNKKVSFKDDQDIADWKHHMEIMLNLPKSHTFFIARVHDILENATDFFVVMEAVSGEDLFEYCAREKLYKRPDRLEIAKQVALEVFSALKDLCDLGLIHKDLKLENVVLDAQVDDSPPGTPKKHPKLNAFCKMVDFDTTEEWVPGSRARDILGTDQYIAPEAYSGFYAPASDVWAIGVMLYKMLTGVFPFHEDIFDDEPGQNYVGHPKMKQIRCRLKLAKIDFSHDVWQHDSVAKDFVKRCLQYDEKKRMPYNAALEHPWIFEDYQLLCSKMEMLHRMQRQQASGGSTGSMRGKR